ncbi:MAG: hypothetical protein AMJ46_10810 [Latescibacteria bacterium DG_63]|nr:MAG: hypothetical protein AMJ46_10810 [Latescibacteria bacterium DG_63]
MCDGLTPRVPYDIGGAGRVALRIFDVDGSLVRTLVDRWHEPAMYSGVWDGWAEDGRELARGVYFYQLEAGDFTAARKPSEL